MASPVLETFCCMHLVNDSNGYCNVSDVHANSSCISTVTNHDFMLVNISYNSLCIASSAISICGAVYQLTPRVPRHPVSGSRQLQSMLRQNMIICWLAFADLLASIGVLVRSSLWINGKIPSSDDQFANSTFAHYFCAVSSAWVQYFYICTYFWTLIYAIDILRLTKRKPCLTPVYHLICWVLSAIICSLGLIFLYYPDLFSCSHEIGNLLPHYLSSYIPICLVMIINPVLYSKTSAAVKQHFYNNAVFTQSERSFINAAKTQFRSFVVVFYVCWLPNVLNGIITLICHIMHSPKPGALMLMIWHLMAVVNPLQAFLNSIVYRGVGVCYEQVILKNRPDDENGIFSRLAEGSSTFAGTNSDETSPLLRPFDASIRT